MKVWIRNLTKDEDLEINLPVTEEKLDKLLDPNDEYIILQSEILDVGEYDSIDELNEFLQECEDSGNIKTLEILSATYLYHEVREMMTKGYTIVNFDTITEDWYGGSGGNFTNAAHKGMCLYDSGFYNPFHFEMNDEIYDWIDWDSVWINAETVGWREVNLNGEHYLVHKGE